MNADDHTQIQRLDLFISELSIWNKLERVLWNLVSAILIRPSPRTAFRWRRFWLRRFGASIGKQVRIYPSARIFLPRNLQIDDFAVIGPETDLYSVALIQIGQHSMVSQRVVLCGATHDYKKMNLPLIASPITIGSYCWVCADAFICPGVSIGKGAVVGARSVVVKNVDERAVVAGNPARFIKRRETEFDS